MYTYFKILRCAVHVGVHFVSNCVFSYQIKMCYNRTPEDHFMHDIWFHDGVIIVFLQEPEDDQHSDGLHIKYHGKDISEILDGKVKKYEVIAEQELVCSSEDFIRALCVLMVAHYVFNMTYHPKLNSTLTFLQKVIMNIKDGNPNPKKLINLLFQVNSRLKMHARKCENWTPRWNQC